MRRRLPLALDVLAPESFDDGPAPDPGEAGEDGRGLCLNRACRYQEPGRRDFWVALHEASGLCGVCCIRVSWPGTCADCWPDGDPDDDED
jgi:hypothetical protein